VPTRARIWHAPRVQDPIRLALVLALLLAPRPAPAEPELLDGIAAQVDDQVVLVSEVIDSTRAQEQAMRAAGAPDTEIARLRSLALEKLIEERLLQRIIEQNEMKADDAEVNRTIEQIAAENGLSVEQLYASVVFHGLSLETYRRQIKGDIERRNLINAAVSQDVEVTDAAVRALFEERFGDQPVSGDSVRVRQILRAVGGPAKRKPAVACAEARAARQRVVAGEDFAEVASEVSEVAPRDGGDIGWLPLDNVAPWMRDALDGLEAGEMSELLELPFGCSVLQLVERKALEPVTFERAEPTLRSELFERSMQDAYRSWLEELRENSFIDRRGYFSDPTRFLPPSAGLAEPDAR